MSPSLPAHATSNVPSTKAWLLLLGVLTVMLIIANRVQPPLASPLPVLARQHAARPMPPSALTARRVVLGHQSAATFASAAAL